MPLKSIGGEMDINPAYEGLQAAILNGEEAEASRLARQIVDGGSELMPAVAAATEAIRLVGDRFGAGECFLPELVLSAEAMQAFMGVVTPHLAAGEAAANNRGKAVVGTVKGDIHNIGKSIVATMLKAAGFEVIDLGVNVTPMDFIDTAEKSGAQVIGLSALMTTSMPYQKEVVKLLQELGERHRYWVVLGGGPVTSGYARSIGANGWAGDAAAAVRVIDRMLASGGDPAGADFYAEEK
jgi:trimethylamine corrinoid protein